VKYHITDDGPKPCTATVRDCKFSQKGEKHYETEHEAFEEFEKRMINQDGKFQFQSIQTLSKKREKTVTIGQYSVPKKFEKEFEYIYQTVHSNFDEVKGLGEEFSNETMDLIHEHMENTDSIIPSRTRVVFLEDDSVVKIPITEEGMLDCGREKQASDRYKANPDDYIPIADTELVEKGDVFYTRMEKVRLLERVDYKNLPFWVSMVDSGQVGYTKDNVLVAYDL